MTTATIPPPCNPEIFKTGTPVFMTASIASERMEQLVKLVAEKSGQKVDWHFCGGRAVVIALGDLDLVRWTIQALRSEFRKAYMEETEAYASFRQGVPWCFLNTEVSAY